MRSSYFGAFALMAPCVLTFVGCTPSSGGFGDECELPVGLEVVSMSLDEDEAGELPATGEHGFSVTVELNRAITSDESPVLICYAVRDSELIGGLPLAVGFVGVSTADDETITRAESFNMTCDGGDVAGRAVTSLYDMDDWDRSSGERSTRIYVQHLNGLRTFLGLTVGISGESSNRIRIECPS